MHTGRLILATWTLLAVAFAGCFGDDDGAADDATGRGDGDGATLPPDVDNGTAAVPTIEDFEDPSHFCAANGLQRQHAPDLEGRPWRFGQSWTYSLRVDGVDHGSTRLIYYDLQDNGQHYMVGTPTREEALQQAVLGVNPMIGRVHQALYSPHESGEHADMFHFPLCDGSSWTTVFYGEAFSLTAAPARIAVPAQGDADGYRITGQSTAGSRLTIDYALAAQWFTRIDLVRPDASGVNMDLTGIDTGYSGDAFFLRGQQDARVDLNDTGLATTTVTRADGKDGAYDTIGVRVDASTSCPAVAGRIDITAPNGTVVWQANVTPGAPLAASLFELPYAPGDWTFRVVGVPDATASCTTVAAAFDVVSIYDRSGTVG